MNNLLYILNCETCTFLYILIHFNTLFIHLYTFLYILIHFNTLFIHLYIFTHFTYCLFDVSIDLTHQQTSMVTRLNKLQGTNKTIASISKSVKLNESLPVTHLATQQHHN